MRGAIMLIAREEIMKSSKGFWLGFVTIAFGFTIWGVCREFGLNEYLAGAISGAVGATISSFMAMSLLRRRLFKE
jgi:hypothetical protein